MRVRVSVSVRCDESEKRKRQESMRETDEFIGLSVLPRGEYLSILFTYC